MDFGVGIASGVDGGKVAQRAEALGFTHAWFYDTQMLCADVFVSMALAAVRTSRIRLGTGVLVPPNRIAPAAANGFATLLKLAPGRIDFGVGTGFTARNTMGLPAMRLDDLREYVRVVEGLLAGETVQWQADGAPRTIRFLDPGGGLLAVGRRIPLHVSAFGPRARALTAEVADGWLGTSFMPDHARVFLDHLETGARRAGRALADLDLQAGGAVAFGDDVERLIAARKPGLAFTLGAMGSRQHNFYNDAFRRAGYEDAAREVQRLWLDGKRDEAAARVPDELALKANLLGTEAMVRERLAVYRRAGVTTLRVEPAGSTLAARLDTLGRLMALIERP